MCIRDSPIINENDTVATEEIRYGDNDRLAARVAQMIDADLLIMLSDVDGLYSESPTKNKYAKKIVDINEINESIERKGIELIAPLWTDEDSNRFGWQDQIRWQEFTRWMTSNELIGPKI